MSKTNSENEQINQFVKLGERNKSLLPRVKNWCKHIEIKDRSAGLIAEMYKLPTNLSISCPHTNSFFTAANFEWIARDFILDNCQSCSFHQEITSKNFGREVIKTKKEYLDKQAEKLEYAKQAKSDFKKYIEEIKLKEKHKTKIPELSVIKLLDELEDGKLESISSIIEASKLSPLYFNQISIDYLCLYLDDNDVNDGILEVIYNISQTNKDFSSFSIERLTESIKHNFQDITSGILNNVLSEDYFLHNSDLVGSIIDSLEYERGIGYYGEKHSYPNSINLFLRIHNLNGKYTTELLKEKLSINDKSTRININGFLQELLDKDNEYSFVKDLTDNIILSLELDDDSYNDSADAMTCETLFKLYLIDSAFIIDKLVKKYKQLSSGAFVELFRLFEKIIRKGNFNDAQSLLEILFEYLSSKNTDIKIRGKIVEIFDRITRERFEVCKPYFENFVGLLINFHSEIATFNYYKNELKENKVSTFNPIQHLNIYEIESLEIKQSKIQNDLQSIISKHIIEDSTRQNYSDFLNTMNGLSSDKDGELKSILISVLIKSSKEQIEIAEYLPKIHNHILDIHSIHVRTQGMNFIIKLLNDYPQLITQTFIDLIKVFLNDSDIIIRKKAVEAYSYILAKFQDQVESEDIEVLCKNMIHTRVIVHKAVIELSYKILPYLDTKQKIKWFINIISWEATYFNEGDFYYSKDLVKIILYYNNEINSANQSNIIKEYYQKYCNCPEYYVAIDFVKELNRISDDFPNLEDFWLEQTLNFISKLRVDYIHNHEDIIEPFFNTLYNKSHELLSKNEELFLKFIENRIAFEDYRTILRLLKVLLYYNLHEILNTLCLIFESKVPKNQSNIDALEFNGLFYEISRLELAVKDNLDILPLLNNEN
ncbi:hypothetical protein [Soonwooa purpurea]